MLFSKIFPQIASYVRYLKILALHVIITCVQKWDLRTGLTLLEKKRVQSIWHTAFGQENVGNPRNKESRNSTFSGLDYCTIQHLPTISHLQIVPIRLENLLVCERRGILININSLFIAPSLVLFSFPFKNNVQKALGIIYARLGCGHLRPLLEEVMK